jgi:hypothetical protein
MITKAISEMVPCQATSIGPEDSSFEVQEDAPLDRFHSTRMDGPVEIRDISGGRNVAMLIVSAGITLICFVWSLADVRRVMHAVQQVAVSLTRSAFSFSRSALSMTRSAVGDMTLSSCRDMSYSMVGAMVSVPQRSQAILTPPMDDHLELEQSVSAEQG